MVKPNEELKSKIKTALKSKSKVSDETLNKVFVTTAITGKTPPDTLNNDEIEAIVSAISNMKTNESLWDVAKFVSQELGVFIPHDYVKEIYNSMQVEFSERNKPKDVI